MATLTAFVLAAFVGYAASWYVGLIEGNFALLMFMATVVTGLYWLAERFYFLPQRLAAAQQLARLAYRLRDRLQADGAGHRLGDDVVARHLVHDAAQHFFGLRPDGIEINPEMAAVARPFAASRPTGTSPTIARQARHCLPRRRIIELAKKACSRGANRRIFGGVHGKPNERIDGPRVVLARQ